MRLELGSYSSDCDTLGVPLSSQEIVRAHYQYHYHWYRLDTTNMEVCLPADKLHLLQEAISGWLHWKTATRREMLSLIGKLAHTCKVVRPGLIE